MKPLTRQQYRALRQSLGTQTEVGKLLGVDWSTVQRRESGKHAITVEMSLALRSVAQNKDLADALKSAIDAGGYSTSEDVASVLDACLPTMKAALAKYHTETMGRESRNEGGK